MNGLANAILTLLLSWLRIIINRFWSLLNSESGTSFYQFLSQHWLKVLLVLLVGGFLLDRLIYFIRWQPFRVWFRRRRSADRKSAQNAVPAEPDYFADARSRYVQPPAEPVWQESDTAFYKPQKAQQPAEPTAVYARPAVDRSAFMPPMEPVDPVFDDAPADWADGEPLTANPAQTRTHPPVSDRYMQDVQSGFARPVPPEQLYAAPVQENRPDEPQAYPQPELQSSGIPADAQPVHPGLDADVLRQNMGLGWEYPTEETYFDDYVDYDEAPGAPAFTPFTQKAAGNGDGGKKNRNPFMNLMRLVSDESRPSIKDLQSTVDVRTAFHEPVFPKQTFSEEDE